MRRTCVRAVLLLVLLAPCAAAAEDVETYGELGIQGGFFLPDRNLSGKPQQFQQIEAEVGLRGAYFFRSHWAWFADAQIFDINTATGAGDADVSTLRSGFEYLIQPLEQKLQWFVGFGGGVMNFDLENMLPLQDDSFTRTFGSVGIGQRYALDRRAHFRWELRADRSLDDDGLLGKDVMHPQFIVGVAWAMGLAGDGDGDGVPDSRDRCPKTPAGARVDASGCELDSDGDGVVDGQDKCPRTPPGARVDARGCPADADGDGVHDGIDRCPGTPRGARVDAIGCPADADGDGVYDGIDRCPGTPRGARVDATGCPQDGDGDGVYDGIDKCPRTEGGTEVNAEGCPRAEPLFEPQQSELILDGVFFEIDRAVLTPASRTTLDRVARSLKDWPEVRVEIGGHTDGTATDAYNLELSARRADAVLRYLRDRGVPLDQLTARGYGESRPIATNETIEGRRQNRRVELTRRN